MISHIIIKDAVSAQSISGRVSHDISDADPKDTVLALKTKVAGRVQLTHTELDLIYCGIVLHDNATLESCGISVGSSLLAVKKTTPEVVLENQFDAAAMQRLSTAIKIRTHQNFQIALENVLSDPTTVNSIVSHHPSLVSDPISVGLLRDADLLMMTLADSTSRLRVFEAHPALCDAVVELMEIVNKQLNISRSARRLSARQQYNLDRMDMEEDDAPDDAADNMEVNANVMLNPSHAAGGGAGGVSRGPLITTDFVQQALLAAISGNVAESPPPSNSTSAVTEAQIQQLRDMGIVDESLARRALEASGGDIQAALEFLFGDDDVV